jgi:hypothetical protein
MLANDVLAALEQHEVPAKPYDCYMAIRDTKPVLTRGWRMGVERFLAWVLQHDDIRDLTIIARMKGDMFAPQFQNSNCWSTAREKRLNHKHSCPSFTVPPVCSGNLSTTTILSNVFRIHRYI